MKKIAIFLSLIFLAGCTYLEVSDDPVVQSSQDHEAVLHREGEPVPAAFPSQHFSVLSGGPASFAEPLFRAQDRVLKKPFGVLIDPDTSPVQPERFSGYHTGVDFEILDGELDQDVAVFAICDGKISHVRWVRGYGGVITQSCMMGDERIFVLYGHIAVHDTIISAGETVRSGQRISVLGDHLSQETDGERKHLHLGISLSDDLRGYVSERSALGQWLNYLDL